MMRVRNWASPLVVRACSPISSISSDRVDVLWSARQRESKAEVSEGSVRSKID